MTMTYATAKNRSYDVRRKIAAIVGAPESHDFATEIECLILNPTTGSPEQATLLVTSNAGFRGIEGWFRSAETGATFFRSLGFVLATTDRDELVEV